MFSLLKRTLVLGLASALSVLALLADETHSHHDHDVLGNIGTATFPSSCSKAAQTEINRGVTLIHSFWYSEAEAAFRKAADADAKCGIAWWGVAMSNFHPLWAPPTPSELATGREAAQKARTVGAKTAREREYIEAINAFYDGSDTIDHRSRAVAYEKAMESLAGRNPKDREGSIFYALSLVGTALPSDKTYVNQKKAAEILNRILPDIPEHPGIAHYVIHSFDYPALASLALPAARTYAKLAPGSPHALHMPSHIFTRLGLWDESIVSNLASASKARSYVVARKGSGVTAFDELHATDYLVYAYLQQQRYDEARALLDLVNGVSRLDTPSFSAFYALGAVPARYALERRQWKEAAALRAGAFEWANAPYAEANVHFARAIGAARTGDLELTRDALARITLIGQLLVQQKNSYWAEQVEIQRKAAEAWLRFAEGNNDKALELMRQAADLEGTTEKHPVTPGAVIPARELLADLLLELGRPDEALVEVERSLLVAPNRWNGLFLASRAAELGGKTAKVTEYQERIASLTRNGKL